MKKTFARNLQIGFGLSLLLLVLTSIISYYSISNLISSANLVDHTNQIIQRTQNLISYLKDAETGQRGYLLTGQPEFLDPYTGAYENCSDALKELKELTKDNFPQQQTLDSLTTTINKRFNVLQQGLDAAKNNQATDIFLFKEGKVYMDKARELVKVMENREQDLLADRTENMKRYVGFSPVFIILTAILSIIITVVFFRRLQTEYEEKTTLYDSLDKKDKQITNRISVIESIAKQISSGDYKIRLSSEENDTLGSLSSSLNTMASSLEGSFNILTNNEWLQSGIALLNERMMGEDNIDILTSNIIETVSEYTNSQLGLLYLVNNHDSLILENSYGLVVEKGKEVPLKEGIAGQSLSGKKEILVRDIEEDLYLHSAAGQIKPRNIFCTPIYYEKNIIGVLKVASIYNYTEAQLEFIRKAAYGIGIEITGALNQAKLQELLEETQAQAEELQSQHTELENINAELEAQSDKLQTSEEELRVQQEELMETNQELEERTRLLEEKNHMIVLKNLEIQKKAEELTISAKYKSEFLANMSHELRTPLNSILILSKLLSENNFNNLNKEQVEYAKVIQSSGNGLLQLIDEILDLSKIESGKMTLSYETVEVSELLNDLRMLFQPLTKEKNVELNIKIDTNVPAKIETDRFRIDQILKNLLSNAIKFTTRGSIDLTVKNDENKKGFINFIVKDTGIGIPPEKQELIFEAFQQADGSTKRKYGGTGLGLSISRQLARLLSGDIMLKSEEGDGSEFTLNIPTSPVQKDETKEEHQEAIPLKPNGLEKVKTAKQSFVVTEIPAEIPDDRNNLQQGDKIILIIEDDTSFAKALLDFSRQKKYKGIVAVRGDHGIELAQQYKPVGILLDVQLPIIDGMQVIEELKKDARTKHIPVHMMSSYDTRKDSIMKGAVDFISKPFLIEKLNEILEKTEAIIKNETTKVVIVEDNSKHAKALADFLTNHKINAETTDTINGILETLKKKEVNCVVLDMGVPGNSAYDTLETIKANSELKDTPIIIFTGKSISRSEEAHIKQYADSIVVKTAHSYQRILDEVSLFLHLVEQKTEEQNNGAPKKQTSLNEILKNKKVLVADDDVRNVFSLTKVLERYDMEIISALDGNEALQALNDNPGIDIILMDIMMPVMDGFEAINRIRKNPKWQKLPIIAVTAKAMIGDREKCIQAGASDYISKPIDTDQLISLIRVWLYDGNKY